MIFERNLHLLTSRIASLVTAGACSERVDPENSRIALVLRRPLDVGRVLSLLTGRPA